MHIQRPMFVLPFAFFLSVFSIVLPFSCFHDFSSENHLQPILHLRLHTHTLAPHRFSWVVHVRSLSQKTLSTFTNRVYSLRHRIFFAKYSLRLLKYEHSFFRLYFSSLFLIRRTHTRFHFLHFILFHSVCRNLNFSDVSW